MEKKPVIGLLAGRLSTDFNSCGRHFVNDTYVNAIIKTGGLPFMIPIVDRREDREALLSMCDAVMFPGGHDVNPLCYHEDPHPLQGESSLRYDRFQIAMYEMADRAGLPMLGICRGIQLMNVAAGGTLYQDVSLQKESGILKHQMEEKDHGESGHYLKIEEGSLLHDLFGSEITVNSFHHQAVKDPAAGYRVTARADDDTIEAIEREGDVFCVGVQWHPEVMFDAFEDMRPLFEAFVDAAKKKQSQK